MRLLLNPSHLIDNKSTPCISIAFITIGNCKFTSICHSYRKEPFLYKNLYPPIARFSSFTLNSPLLKWIESIFKSFYIFTYSKYTSYTNKSKKNSFPQKRHNIRSVYLYLYKMLI